MESFEPIEEEVTRSNFALLENHYLDVKGSMGLFGCKMPDLSAITVHETTTQPFFNSKCSSSSVFDRLAADTNRRNNASMMVQDYRLMLELEYENSFLNKDKLSCDRETKLISRLMSDSERRKRNKETAEKLKKVESQCIKGLKWPAEKTDRVVKRLFIDKRGQSTKREEIKKSIEELEIRTFEEIRNARHPRRKVDDEVIKRISTSRSPEYKCSSRNCSPDAKVGSMTRRENTERLHKVVEKSCDSMKRGIFKDNKEVGLGRGISRGNGRMRSPDNKECGKGKIANPCTGSSEFINLRKQLRNLKHYK